MTNSGSWYVRICNHSSTDQAICGSFCDSLSRWPLLGTEGICFLVALEAPLNRGLTFNVESGPRITLREPFFTKHHHLCNCDSWNIFRFFHFNEYKNESRPPLMNIKIAINSKNWVSKNRFTSYVSKNRNTWPFESRFIAYFIVAYTYLHFLIKKSIIIEKIVCDANPVATAVASVSILFFLHLPFQIIWA